MGILNHLLQKGEVSDSFVAQATQMMQERSVSEEEAVLELGLTPDVVRAYFSEEYGIPAYALKEAYTIPQDVLAYVTEDTARHYGIIPLEVTDGVLLIGINDPDNLQVREVLNFVSSKSELPYKLVFMLRREIDTALKSYENLKGEVSSELVNLESELEQKLAERAEEVGESEKKPQSEHIEEDAPVTKIVATILRYAVDGGASDIHIEPLEEKVLVRFRVDGLLSKSLELPRNVHSPVVARVKILSSMRLDEKRKPQDGRFGATFDNRQIDFRVSVLPTNHGEKVVMRILDNERGVSKLEDTGISKHHMDVIKRMVNEPYGIIIISGPTGSGKSTTLYAMLKEVDRDGKNVLSLEDPVEYNIDGVSQSQVRPEIGYTFANGLRAALRQDPDIIMVGEIRDKETAQLAIQAALTGHLVFSTLHTNNAIGVIPRLIDMGIDPYLIAPTLKLAIAQRLARRLCDDTGREEPVTKSMEAMMSDTFSTLPEKYMNRVPKSRTVLHPNPTPQCATGMRGRVAIMEVLEITEQLQELILRNASEEEIFNIARSHGFMTMKEDAIVKALNHIIPYQEMNAFGSKAGAEEMFDELAMSPVDNQETTQPSPAIIEGNENVTG